MLWPVFANKYAAINKTLITIIILTINTLGKKVKNISLIANILLILCSQTKA